MIEFAFVSTQIHFISLILLVVSLFCLQIELKIKLKGIMAGFGGLLLVFSVLICFIFGTPIIEQLFLYLLYLLVLLLIVDFYLLKENNSTLLKSREGENAI